jgi:hypothetical protein
MTKILNQMKLTKEWLQVGYISLTEYEAMMSTLNIELMGSDSL